MDEPEAPTLNVFVDYQLIGGSFHIKVFAGTAKQEIASLLDRAVGIEAMLVEKGYTKQPPVKRTAPPARRGQSSRASASRGGRPGAMKAAYADFPCPDCDGKVYDNTEENAKRARRGDKRMPVYKCANKDCEWVDWGDGDE